jgi:hypothetical protein
MFGIRIFGLRRLTKAIVKLTAEVVRLQKVIGLRQPGLVFVRMVFERPNGMSKFQLVLPESLTADVVVGGKKMLAFSVGGGEVINQEVSGDALASEEFDGTEGQFATGTLIEVDDAGNSSPPRDFNVELKDTIAPGLPGEVGVKMISE